MRKLLLIGAFVIVALPVQAKDIYIGQTATGAANGADCADAYAYTFFNSSANWGSGSAQIGPGTTVHLCGTFTAPAGASNYLTFQGGGSSSSSVTLHFETGALVTATYWAGPVINLNGQSYVTVDGGTNGTIQATANGSTLANSQDNGICVNNGTPAGNSTNVTIENLTCSNLYVDSSVSDSGGEDTYGFDIWNVSNLVIQNNNIHDVKWAIRNSYATGSTYTNALTMNGNDIYNMDHGYFMTDSSSSGTATASGFYIYGNTFGSMANWDNTADNNHHDWIHLNANSMSSRFSGFYIYDNLAQGDVGLNANSGLFTNESGQSTSNVSGAYFFNNVYVNTSTAHCFADGFVSWAEGGSLLVANNTFISDDQSGCTNNGSSLPGDNGIAYESSINLTWENNLTEGMQNNFLYLDGGTNVTAIDYNDYYVGGGWTSLSGANTSSFTSWEAMCNCDSSSITSNPSLTANFQPTSSLNGINLTSLCTTVSQLCTDKGGNSRPATGTWSMGAYQFGSSAAVQPATGLTATPH